LTERMNYKYVRYSIGELILVVFGILIALQINNWNEERIQQMQFRVVHKVSILVSVKIPDLKPAHDA